MAKPITTVSFASTSTCFSILLILVLSHYQSPTAADDADFPHLEIAESDDQEAPFEAPAPSPTDEDDAGDYYAPFEAPASSPTDELLYDVDYAPLESPSPAPAEEEEEEEEDDFPPFEAPAPSELSYDNYYAPLEAPSPTQEDDYAPIEAPAPSPTEEEEEDDYAPLEAPAPSPIESASLGDEGEDLAAPFQAPLQPTSVVDADSMEADDDDVSMEMNAAEGGGGGGGGWSKAGVGVLGSACLLGIGAFVYKEKRSKGDGWRRRRGWDYESLYKKKKNETSMSKKHEVELLPMLA